MKNSNTKNTHFRTWKKGKSWIYASAVLGVLALGTGVVAAVSVNSNHPVIVNTGATNGTATNVDGSTNSKVAGAKSSMDERITLAATVMSQANSLVAGKSLNATALSAYAQISSVATSTASAAAAIGTQITTNYALITQTMSEYNAVASYDALASSYTAAGNSASANSENALASSEYAVYATDAYTANSNFDAYNKNGHTLETAIAAAGTVTSSGATGLLAVLSAAVAGAAAGSGAPSTSSSAATSSSSATKPSSSATTSSSANAYPVEVLTGATDGTATKVDGTTNTELSGAYNAMINRESVAASDLAQAKSLLAENPNDSAAQSAYAQISSIAASATTAASSIAATISANYTVITQSKSLYATVQSDVAAGNTTAAQKDYATYLATASLANNAYMGYDKVGHQLETALTGVGGSKTDSSGATTYTGLMALLSAAVAGSTVASSSSATSSSSSAASSSAASANESDVATGATTGGTKAALSITVPNPINVALNSTWNKTTALTYASAYFIDDDVVAEQGAQGEPIKDGTNGTTITVTGNVDTATAGTYPVTYTVTNTATGSLAATVTVNVVVGSGDVTVPPTSSETPGTPGTSTGIAEGSTAASSTASLAAKTSAKTLPTTGDNAAAQGVAAGLMVTGVALIGAAGIAYTAMKKKEEA
ncbi:MAG: KxYKxGKxW signal peptide domain-containing protein [Streptococcaceae bacterium]|jgi:hypothetical protein|nr:KxYKxGKxW signal peptide domain-containing protein [Streptococcaceae bacterium]